MTTSYIFERLDELIREEYSVPKDWSMKGGDDILFQYQSYKNWAVNEIKVYILAHPELGVREAVEDFRTLMDDLACRVKTGDASFIFSVAYDTATDILDWLLNLKGEKE